MQVVVRRDKGNRHPYRDRFFQRKKNELRIGLDFAGVVKRIRMARLSLPVLRVADGRRADAAGWLEVIDFGTPDLRMEV